MLPTIDGVSPSCVALPHGPWATVLDFLAERIPAVSRAEWMERMRQGEVVNAQGSALSDTTPYRAHVKVYYWRKLPFEHKVPFEERVVFQDAYLVVAHKPHFLPVTPKGRYVQETLLVRLKRRLGIDTLAPMHRIDRETAGLVVFTVQPHTRNAYQSLLRDRLVDKTYEAIAPVNPALTFPLVHRSRLVESERFMAMQEVDGPVNAETHIDLIETDGKGLGRFKLRPVTGQKHQLRAHMNALGMPIVGDQIYPVLMPAAPLEQPSDFSKPLQLLAQSIAFADPVTGLQRTFDGSQRLDLSTAGRNLTADPSPRPSE